jgi:acyl dehydratase
MVINVAIGQTTYATQNVMGNLFYRGLVLKRQVYIGDTLTTRTQIVSLRQNKAQKGRAASGLAVLEIWVTNQHGDDVLHFWRCPMVPCRDANVETGHADDFDVIPSTIRHEDLVNAVPHEWQLSSFQQNIDGVHFSEVEEGANYIVQSRDTVTNAPELARLTLNLAKTHTDAGASIYGKRLVYGGHAISIAAAQMIRALPNVMTLIAWRFCEHIAPVFEGDILRSEVTVDKKTELEQGGGLLDIRLNVYAERGEYSPTQGADVHVLDWGVVVLMA